MNENWLIPKTVDEMKKDNEIKKMILKKKIDKKFWTEKNDEEEGERNFFKQNTLDWSNIKYFF